MMSFVLPPYQAPVFTAPPLAGAPCVNFAQVTAAGVAPDGYHATSIFPEYFQLTPGDWRLAAESRMDCVVVREAGDQLAVREFRRLRVGDLVALGRDENGKDGIFVNSRPFVPAEQAAAEKFVFRAVRSRETPFSNDYDELYALLEHERHHGRILWVVGPALAFDRDTREALVRLIESGFVHGLLAGNALAVHDVEADRSGTALGQDLYHSGSVPQGHYRHLDAINTVRRAGSLEQAVTVGLVQGGIMHALLTRGIPFVLAGSIRDDGPLPGVVTDAVLAQDGMRELVRGATTIIGLATQLHTIATGNLAPVFRVLPDGRVRPVYFYVVDMSEFAAAKLSNRGSLAARAILTNVQDFIVTLERGLNRRCR
jgi:hypothetical protein